MHNKENPSSITLHNDDINQEIKRLKMKFNELLNHYHKATQITELEQGQFVLFLVLFFVYVKEEKLIMVPAKKTKNTEKYIYIAVSDYYNYMLQKCPSYKKKQLIDYLKKLRFIDEDEKNYTTIYNGKRVLKIYKSAFYFLSEGSVAND